MVTRWDPFSEALSLRDAMNRLFEQAVLQPTGEAGRSSEGSGFAPALDVHESQDAYTVKASLPGVRPEDVNIQYQQGVLSISGVVHDDRTQQQGSYHLRERRFGRFSRSLSLPETVDVDRAQASFEHGVLELRLPKAEEMKPRRIQVQTGGSSASSGAQIGTGSTASSGQAQPSGAVASSAPETPSV
jgi:HSP20 family protein